MAWIAELVAAAASTYGGIRQQQAAKRNANNASALNNLNQGGGGGGGFQPSAKEFMNQDKSGDLGGLGLKDLLGADKPQEPQTFSLDKASFSPGAQAPAAGASDKDFHLFSGNEFADTSKPQTTPAQQEQPADTGLGTNDYIGLAQSAGSIASQLAQGPPAPPGFMPSPGPMNYQPTALQMLLARQRRGM